MPSYQCKLDNINGIEPYMRQCSNTNANQSKSSHSSTSMTCLFALLSILSLTVASAGVVLYLRGSNVICTFDGLIQQDAENVTIPDANDLQSDSFEFTAPKQEFRYGAIATDDNLCAAIGNDVIMQHGGSAVDGAIATAFCNGVVSSHLCGIGGGFIMTVHDKSKIGTNRGMSSMVAREMAPESARTDMYVNSTEDSIYGVRSIGVPGEVMGHFKAWQKFGKVSEFRTLVEPTIRLCKEGIPVTKPMHAAYMKKKAFIMADDQEFREIFRIGEREIEVGDKYKNLKLAHTLETIADNPMSFYNGSLAADIIADIKEQGGNMTLEDLGTYTVDESLLSTLQLNNGNFTTYSVKPPAGGTAFQYILNILDGFNMTQDDQEHMALMKHRMVEAFKFSFAKRGEFGDSSVVNVSAVIDDMLDLNTGRGVRARIDDEKTYSAEHYFPVHSSVDDSGTSHVSVLTADGSAVALTSTINMYFGSTIRGKRTGIIFNNQMGDFSTPDTQNPLNGLFENVNNYPEAEKRPMSSTCPTIVLDENDKVRLVIGGAGGQRIPTAVAQVFINHLWLGMPLWKAMSYPRLHHQLSPQRTLYESGLCKHQVADLKAKGHNLVVASFFGRIAAIEAVANVCSPALPSLNTCIHATADPRRYTTADGY